METRIPARLTPREGRQFAFTVSGAMLAAGALLAWKSRESAAVAVTVIALALGLAGAFIPGSLGPVHRAWMGLAHQLSRITTPIVMGILFFVVITPLGLLRRLLGKSSTRAASPTTTNWHRRPAGTGRSDLSRQF